MRADVERHVQSSLPSLRTSWFLMLAVCLAWVGLGVLASPVVSSSGATTSTPITTTITVFGVLSAVATLWIDRALITPERMAALIPVFDYALVHRHLLAGHLVLWSLAELSALLGFAQLFLDGTLHTHLALCAVSLGALAVLMPTRARIAARMTAVLR